MGCHTWFYRKLSQEEVKGVKEKTLRALQHMLDMSQGKEALIKELNEYIELIVNLDIDNISQEEVDIMCLSSSLELHEDSLYEEVPEFHDAFRVGYCDDVITSVKQCVEFCKEMEAPLDNDQIFRLVDFFNRYPDGIINFG